MTARAHASHVDLRRPSRRPSGRQPRWLPTPGARPAAEPDRGLRRVDLRDLRSASALLFYSSGAAEQMTGQIVARRENRRGEQTDRPVEVGASVRAYDRAAAGSVSCYEMVHHVGAAERTWLRALRAGDELTLLWVRANQCEALDQAGLIRDELHLHAQRPGAGGKLRDVGTWIVSVRVGQPSPIRMVRFT